MTTMLGWRAAPAAGAWAGVAGRCCAWANVAPPGNVPVDAEGRPLRRFDLASPYEIAFGIIAGNVADTVDGRLSDRGLTVEVDFVQPASYDPSQSRFQSRTDSSGRLAGGTFGPFSFRYDEFFLQDRLIASGAREQLFNIVVTAIFKVAV